MQKTFAFLLLLMLVTVVAGESRSQSNQTQDEQQLREIESRTAKCEQQNDVSMMSLFADDFVVSSKKVLSKQQVEEAVKNNLFARGTPDRAKMMDVFRRHGMTLAAPPPVK